VGPLARARRAGQRLEPGIDLERVGRHGDRLLPQRAQARGQCDRDRGLAHTGGAEQRDHLGTAHDPQYRAAMIAGATS